MTTNETFYFLSKYSFNYNAEKKLKNELWRSSSLIHFICFSLPLSKKIVRIFTDFEVGNQRPDLHVGKKFTDKYGGNFCRILCRDCSFRPPRRHPLFVQIFKHKLLPLLFLFEKVVCLYQKSNSRSKVAQLVVSYALSTRTRVRFLIKDRALELEAFECWLNTLRQIPYLFIYLPMHLPSLFATLNSIEDICMAW